MPKKCLIWCKVKCSDGFWHIGLWVCEWQPAYHRRNDFNAERQIGWSNNFSPKFNYAKLLDDVHFSDSYFLKCQTEQREIEKRAYLHLSVHLVVPSGENMNRNVTKIKYDLYLYVCFSLLRLFAFVFGALSGSINNRCLNECLENIFNNQQREHTMKNVAAAHMKQDYTVKQLKWIYIYIYVRGVLFQSQNHTPWFSHRAHISLAYTYRVSHARSRSIAREHTSCARDMMWMWKVLPPYTRYRVRM